MVDEQPRQSQKYSTRLDLQMGSAGSFSKRNSLPSRRWQNRVEQDGLLHLVSITTPNILCQTLYRPPDFPDCFESFERETTCSWSDDTWHHSMHFAVQALKTTFCSSLYFLD
jgi:hypothetical protein